MDDITRLKKQVKLLAIATVTLTILTVGLLISSVARSKSNEAWPDVTLGKLTAKEVRIVSPDGRLKMILSTHDNDPNVVLLDETPEVRMLLSATTKLGGSLSLRGPDKANKLVLSSGDILMGDATQSSLLLVAPSDGGPRLVLRDEDGYSTTIGKTGLQNKQDGTRSFTLAASIVASSNDSTVTWPLLKTATAKPK